MAKGNDFLDMTIDGKELREFVKTLDSFEPGLRKQFVKDIKSGIKPIADTIASNIPRLGVPNSVRGFGHKGRTSWSKVRASVYATPGGGKSSSVARIEVFGQGKFQAALKIADLAGTKNEYNNGNQSRGGPNALPYTINGQGEALVSRLDEISKLSAGGKGGRFVWKNFIGQRKKMVDIAIKIIDRYADRVNAGGRP
jgi:hypothetical protein